VVVPRVSRTATAAEFGKEDSNLHGLLQRQVAYRWPIPESVTRGSNSPVRFGRPVPLPLGQ